MASLSPYADHFLIFERGLVYQVIAFRNLVNEI